MDVEELVAMMTTLKEDLLDSGGLDEADYDDAMEFLTSLAED